MAAEPPQNALGCPPVVFESGSVGLRRSPIFAKSVMAVLSWRWRVQPCAREALARETRGTGLDDLGAIQAISITSFAVLQNHNIPMILS